MEDDKAQAVRPQLLGVPRFKLQWMIGVLMITSIMTIGCVPQPVAELNPTAELRIVQDDQVSQLQAKEDETVVHADRIEITSDQDNNSTAFIKQELGQMASPFTRETVIELNRIVSKSLKAINAFDKTRKLKQETDAEKLNQFRQLYDSAAKARVEMLATSHRVKTSGERYNKEILAAMVKFVDHVPIEISQEIRRTEMSFALN
ncbi:MAG: hypothetical protein AAF939_11090 [Planctomycetota bacterium]